VHGEAFIGRTPAKGRSRAFLVYQRGRRHLPAGHAVNRVVDKEHGDLLTAVGGMNNLCGSNRRQIAIALVRDHDAFRASAFQSRRRRRSASVGHLHVAHVEVVIGEDGASHRADENGAVLHAQIFECFGDQLMHHAVPAAGAIVGLLLQIRLALIAVIEDVRLGVGNFVPVLVDWRFGCDHFVFVCHDVSGCRWPSFAQPEGVRPTRSLLNQRGHALHYLGVQFLHRRHIASDPPIKLHRHFAI